MGYKINSGHLHLFSIEVHLDQCVSYKMSKATAIEVAVRVSVVFAIVYLWEF